MGDDRIVPTSFAIERNYSDGSGVELGVRYDGKRADRQVEIESIETIRVNLDDLDWLIERLEYVRDTVRG